MERAVATPAGPASRFAGLGVAELRLDWASAIDELRPEIVVIATPGAPHCEIVEHAAARGCHMVCEKPLVRNADEAGRMLAAVRSAGVRHAFGANSRYSDVLIQARDLLVGGAIGDLREIEVVDHFGFPPLMPHSWLHSLAEGGGMLGADERSRRSTYAVAGDRRGSRGDGDHRHRIA